MSTLYDSAGSSFPSHKTGAVVDAMERTTVTTIATTADLRLLRQELISEMAAIAIRQEIQACRFEIVLLRKEMEIFAITVTARFGFMLFVGLSLFYIAMKLTP